MLLQKKAIRVISKVNYNTHTTPLFLENKILPFDKLIKLHKLLFMHSIAYEYAPATFENTWTKNNTRNTGHDLRNQDYFTLPIVRIESFRKFPLYSLANEWNNLGDNIRLQHNRTTFRVALMDELISSLNQHDP